VAAQKEVVEVDGRLMREVMGGWGWQVNEGGDGRVGMANQRRQGRVCLRAA
jgi:hypothetical protein